MQHDFQDLGLFPHMTVAENIGYGLKVRCVDAATRSRRTAEMLDIVALEGYERRRIHQLSGGQRQRVALARALALEPAVLLLDEPLTELDERLRQQLRDEISRLHRRLGATNAQRQRLILVVVTSNCSKDRPMPSSRVSSGSTQY